MFTDPDNNNNEENYINDSIFTKKFSSKMVDGKIYYIDGINAFDIENT